LASALVLRSGDATDSPIQFATANNVRMTISTSGNVGIGTTSPAALLDLGSSYGSPKLYLYNDGTYVNGFGIYANEFRNFFDTIDAAGSRMTWGKQTGGGTFTEFMRLTKDGNVGIGTTSPTGLLHIFGTDPAFRIQNSGTGNMQMGQWDGTNNRIQSSGRDFLLTQTDSFNMLFHTNSTERMRITTGGNVGIGTSSPTYKLTIVNSATGDAVAAFQNTITTGYSGAHILNNAGTLIGHWGYGNASVSGPLADLVYFGSIASKAVVFTTNDTERMRITSGGNVGIGTTSPATLLTVQSSGANGLLLDSNISGSTSSSRLFMRNNADTFAFLVDTNGLNVLSGGTVGSSSGSPKMTITSGGSLLIGTTTEGFLGKLQVAGSVAITGQYNTVLPSSSFSYFDGSGQVVSSSSNASALYLDTTWNTTGNPDGIYLNVTNTASGASSKLLNLKVGSVSQFSVSKAGAIQTTAPSSGSAQPWKLGSYAAGGTGTATGVIYIEINGQIYSIPALQGTP
jgi:hypothetical protein